MLLESFGWFLRLLSALWALGSVLRVVLSGSWALLGAVLGTKLAPKSYREWARNHSQRFSSKFGTFCFVSDLFAQFLVLVWNPKYRQVGLNMKHTSTATLKARNIQSHSLCAAGLEMSYSRGHLSRWKSRKNDRETSWERQLTTNNFFLDFGPKFTSFVSSFAATLGPKIDLKCIPHGIDTWYKI